MIDNTEEVIKWIRELEAKDDRDPLVTGQQVLTEMLMATEDIDHELRKGQRT